MLSELGFLGLKGFLGLALIDKYFCWRAEAFKDSFYLEGRKKPSRSLADLLLMFIGPDLKCFGSDLIKVCYLTWCKWFHYVLTVRLHR